MPNIIQYTREHAPQNGYPTCIISPPQSSPCCFSAMDPMGHPMQEGRFLFQYKRCRVCGFTVRFILREIPDADRLQRLRDILAKSFGKEHD